MYPSDHVLWLPTVAEKAETNPDAFAEAETAEFQQTEDRGLHTYTVLTSSANRTAQAGAYLRLGRVHRSPGDVSAAIADYRQLARFTDVAFDGMPADLLARRAVCDLLSGP